MSMFNFRPRCSTNFRHAACSLLILSSSTFVGCVAIVEPIFYEKRGGISPNTEFVMFKQIMNDYIQRELAGGKLGGGFTWKQFWHIRYQVLRSHNSMMAENEVDYIHRQRAAAGLPLYDDEVSSTKHKNL